MKFTLLFVFCFSVSLNSISQDFNEQIKQTADTLGKKIILSGKKRVCITDFQRMDKTVSHLGAFLCDEISSELANLSDNQQKFRIVEKSRLADFFAEKKFSDFSDSYKMVKLLNEFDMADLLIVATITDFDGKYRVILKMIDTKDGDAINSYKATFLKTPSLENLDKPTDKKEVNVNINPAEQKIQTEEKPVKGGPPGDYCFHNVDPVGYRATVSISLASNTHVLKTISIGDGETNCMLDLPPAVYSITVTWSDRWANSIPSTNYEIRVKSGQSGNLDVRHR